jgi:hypothetical protein
MDSEMKHFQIDNVKKMITGSVQIVEGGHMVRAARGIKSKSI